MKGQNITHQKINYKLAKIDKSILSLLDSDIISAYVKDDDNVEVRYPDYKLLDNRIKKN